jgi:hypothetical protein
MSTDPKLNAAALRPLYEALKECLMAVPLHWTETRASAYAALILAESPAEQPPSGLMQMHGEVDEYGECPNCVNPPHEGPCKRKQPPSGAMTIERAREIVREITDLRDTLQEIIALLPEEHR